MLDKRTNPRIVAAGGRGTTELHNWPCERLLPVWLQLTETMRLIAIVYALMNRVKLQKYQSTGIIGHFFSSLFFRVVLL